MTIYPHWYDRWLEPTLWLGLTGICSVPVFGWSLFRRIPLRGSYFSALFVLALCPYLCFSAIGMVHTQAWRDAANSYEKLGEVLQVDLFGLGITLLEILSYSVVYAAGRCTQDIDAR